LVIRSTNANGGTEIDLGSLGESWAPAGWLADPSETTQVASVVWRVGRRGSDVLTASPRLLKRLCEYYQKATHRGFAYLSPLSVRSQVICWLAALSDMSLRPLAGEFVRGLLPNSRMLSPHLSSQFLFSLSGTVGPEPDCLGAAYDSFSVPLEMA
jgi:hypothetical protein